MSTIRKTISISKKDEKLQNLIKKTPDYEVSHVIRQLMYDGLKYRALVEQGIVNDFSVNIGVNKPYNEEKEIKKEEKEQNTYEYDEFNEEIDLNSVELEEIEDINEDLEDILLKNS